MASDQDIVKQLQQHLRVWYPSQNCGYHSWVKQCEYDKWGRVIRLHLCGLGLSQIPSEVWQLSTLQALNLSNNQLTSLPAELSQLSTLQVLNLSNNQLTSLPAELSQLSTLQWLDLSNNQLTSLPAELGQLSTLQELNLSNNRLTSLPAELGQLSTLQRLYLYNNRLTSLPAELGQLTTLQWLYVDNNPLRTPPPEIIAQGTDAILAYLRTLQRAVVERHEAKLILVGEGGMGKTSLLRALRRQPFTQDLPVTHGIEVNTLRLPHPMHSQQEITLYTWDFGGQDIYQATHQFFLTHRSLYLLVWNPRLGAEACRLLFWLDTIQGHAPDAKILLVATYSDLGSMPTINLATYQRRYPQIVGLCTISNKMGNGLDDLKVKIAQVAAETPFVGQKWPRAWVEVEKQLLTRPEHHIDISVFASECARQKIEDETERETLGRYLHDLGKILYFHDDPVLQRLIVLKPNWISKAVSRVLEDPQVQKVGGVLEHRELARIWATDEQGQPYPRVLYPIFVRMMERFNLCYQLEPERPGLPVTRSLIPQLLLEQPPTSLPPVPTTLAVGLAQVEMRYTLSFVPAGLMSWLLVRTHRYSQRQHWREGARLAYGGQQAHIEQDSHQREIVISVWGPYPYNFLLILKQTLDDLLQSFQGLRVQRKIPCRCSMQEQIPHYHVYEDLDKLLAKGHSKVICPEGMDVFLMTLFYGIHFSTIPGMIATVQKTQKTVTQSLLPADQVQRLLTRLDQGQEFLYRTILNLERQKLAKECPGLFVLTRVSRRPINPQDWVSRAYRLWLMCEYPQGPHTIKGEEGYEVRQGKEWWNAMNPWLRRIVKVLKVGLPMAKTIGDVLDAVDRDRFAAEIDVFNEILADLPEATTRDVVKEAQLDAGVQTIQRLEGAASEAFHTFLKTHPRPWQGLSPVITDDGTILWLCDHHRKEFEAPLIAGI